MPVFHMPISSKTADLIINYHWHCGFLCCAVSSEQSLPQPLSPVPGGAGDRPGSALGLCLGYFGFTLVLVLGMISALGLCLGYFGFTLRLLLGPKGLEAAPTVLLGLVRFALDLKSLQRGKYIGQTLIVLEIETLSTEEFFLILPHPKPQILDSYS